MSKALANRKLFAATGILFVAASVFNLYTGATPAAAHGMLTAKAAKPADMRTGIGPMMPPAEPYCPRPDSCLDK